MDKLRAIETFVAVAETGGFAAASRKLGISAPSVTRIVSDLEADLGVRLLQRTTRQVTLTDIGRQYFEDASVLLADLKTAEDTVKGAHVTPSGTLRVTAPVMFGQHYITPVITHYLSRNSDVSVDALFVDRVVNIVEEGIDVAVRIGSLKDSSPLLHAWGRCVYWCVEALNISPQMPHWNRPLIWPIMKPLAGAGQLSGGLEVC